MKNNQEGQREIQNSLKRRLPLYAVASALDKKNGLVLIKSHQSIEIKTKKASNFKKYSDAEVRFEVLAALKANLSIPNDNITVKVENGWVTLNGDLPYIYQREATKRAVKGLSGVKCVTIHIKTKSHLNRQTSKLTDFTGSIFY
jgi:hypothetical protein